MRTVIDKAKCKKIEINFKDKTVKQTVKSITMLSDSIVETISLLTNSCQPS